APHLGEVVADRVEVDHDPGRAAAVDRGVFHQRIVGAASRADALPCRAAAATSTAATATSVAHTDHGTPNAAGSVALPSIQAPYSARSTNGTGSTGSIGSSMAPTKARPRRRGASVRQQASSGG